jgi:putative tryptophan/tyrosine transport system substrate-binding protein
VAVVGDEGAALASGSLSRPTSNVTGLSTLVNQLTGKRIEFLKELLPTASHFGVLLRMDNPANFGIEERMRPVAESLGVRVSPVSSSDDFETSLHALEQARIEAVVVGADPSFFARRELIVAALASRRIPAIYSVREYVLAGGLMSYAPDYAELGRRAARYVDRILKGAHPSELPIQQAERFELLVNLKAPSALGIKVAPGLLVRADEVIA